VNRLSLLVVLTALVFAGRVAPASDFDVVISEIQYHAPGNLPADEFVEIHNAGAAPVDLSGWRFSEGIGFAFPPGTLLGPKGYLVISPDAAQARSRFGITNVVGNFTGRLDNAEEILALVNAAGHVIARVHYEDEEPWPSRPDGLGPSLELDDVLTPDVPKRWSASAYAGGTPGRANDGDPEESLLDLNEIKPSESGNAGFIEIYNDGPSPAAIGGLAILDATGHRFVLPPSNLPARGHAVITDAQLGFSPTLDGLTYLLVRPGPGGDIFLDALETRAAPQGGSFGRFPDGDDDAYVLGNATRGAANQLQALADVAINEIFFHPPFVPPGGNCSLDCSDLRQWIEVHNRGTASVNVGNWTLSKGVDFTFPAATSIAGGEFLVIASSRTTFLAEHPGFNSARVVGNWTKDLAHDADTINLNDALGNRIDHVEYGDGKPRNDEEPVDGVDDRTFRGSTWPVEADGSGRSVELIHPQLDNRWGSAWAAGPVGGTPAAANAAFSSTPFPVVDEVTHNPAVPAPSDPVTVTCRVSAVGTIQAVEAIWQRDGGAGGGTVTLRDDGLSGDGEAGDSRFGGAIPGQADGIVVRFQVEARLANGRTTRVPRPPPAPPYGGFTGPYFLYQTLSAPLPANRSENYFIILTAADQNELESRSEDSNVLLPCTFIELDADGSDRVRHTCGIRYRGDATRNLARKSYRVAFPSERSFRGIKRLNLNAASPDSEFISADLFRRAGLPGPQEWTVNLTFQGDSDSGYIRKERLDADFLTRHFGDASDGGNFYRALDPSDFPNQGDLEYFGEDPDDYRPYYQKRSKEEEDDYTDIIELCRTFDPVETPDAVFADRIDALIDAYQWARFFALQSLLSNIDGSIQTGTGEDYNLYRVPVGSNRPDAGKWLLVPWDVEETFDDPQERLFRTTVAAARRFLLNPRFTGLYYENLDVLRAGVFSRLEMRKRLALVDHLLTTAQAAAYDAFARDRDAFVEAAFPREISAGAAAASGGATTVIQVGDTWRYWKGLQAPAGAALAWTRRGYAETGWLSGQTGIGYGDGDDATVLADMDDGYTSIYTRRAFNLASPEAAESLRLRIDYDDGFVVYLNGKEVARRNVNGAIDVPMAPDATANINHERGAFEPIDLSSFRTELLTGENILAFHVFNESLSSSDLSFIPELSITFASSSATGCGDVIHASGTTLQLSGQASFHRTHSLLVDGVLADLDLVTLEWTATIPISPGANAVLIEAFEGEGALGARVESKTITVHRIDRALRGVSGTLTGNTRWTAAEGPYLLRGDVTIPDGSRLDIEAGTIIYSQSGASLIVRGEVQALGTTGAPILFRAAGCENPWGGIAIDNAGIGAGDPTSSLIGCDLDRAEPPTGFEGSVAVVNAKLLAEASTFRRMGTAAIDANGSRLEVRRCLFAQTGEAIDSSATTLIATESTFRDIGGGADAIRLRTNGPERSRIDSCTLAGVAGNGIDAFQASADLRDNVLRNVEGRAIALEANGPLGRTVVTGNLIHGSGEGLTLWNGAQVVEGHHNTVYGNLIGLHLMADGSPDGGHGDFHSMIIWCNAEDLSLGASSDASLEFSNISAGDLPGPGNISNDPRFRNVLAADFSLLAASPCIGTGMSGTDMGAIPFGARNFIRTDANGSGTINLTDAVFSLDALFRGGPQPPCLDAADANDDGNIDISDPIFTLFFLFRGDLTPRPPWPAPGPDPTADELDC
jgi:hypothetical protein